MVTKKEYFRNAVHKTAEERLYALRVMCYKNVRLNALPLCLVSKCKCRKLKIHF